MNFLLHAGLWQASVSATAARVADALFSATWEGAALAAFVLVCLRLLPRLSAAARSVVWMSVFLLLALLQVAPLATLHGGATVLAHPAPLQLDTRWSYPVAGAWLGLSLLRAAQLVSGAVCLHRLARRATPVLPDVVLSDAEMQALLRIRSVGGKVRSAELCASSEVARPSVFGFLRPRILLPPELLEKLPAAELRQVVVHEMAHLRRADDWTNLLQKLALVLFPLNPVLLWVERRLCAERELACDDSVLRSRCGRKAYALCLTHLAEHSMLRRSLTLALGAWERQSELVRRVHRILRPAASISGRRSLAVTGGLVAAVLACAALLARSPQLLSFAPRGLNVAQAEHLPARAIPASGNAWNGSEGGARMVNTMARVNARPPAIAARAAEPVVRAAVLHRARRRSAEPRQAWVVMTEWNGADIQSRVVFTVAQDGAPAINNQPGQSAQEVPAGARRASYAAVRLPGGWLIVEI